MIQIFQAGGPVMWPLLACSVITLAVIIERSLFWSRMAAYRRPDAVANLLRKQSLASTDEVAVAESDPVGFVLVAGLRGPPAQATPRMRAAASTQIAAMTHYLSLLNTMVALTPLLGIFGTVLGIIQSFQLLGEATLADPVAASRGLAQALITTAFGLAIAMPSLIAFKYFQSKALEFQQVLETRCTELEYSLGLTEGESERGLVRTDIPELQQG